MKITGNKAASQKAKISATFQLEREVIDAYTKLADKLDIPKQTLINAVLKKALQSEDFTLDLAKDL